jgi:hypothetical protein
MLVYVCMCGLCKQLSRVSQPLYLKPRWKWLRIDSGCGNSQGTQNDNSSKHNLRRLIPIQCEN